MDKTKIDEAKAKLKDARDTVLPKVKSALSEIKTNFKADEGTTGFPKVKSMFVNLWKSGTVGKAALIAAAVIILLLPWVFGGGKVSKIIQLERENDEIALQICELNDLLEKDDELGFFDGRSLVDEKKYEKMQEEIRKLSSEQLNMGLTMAEGMNKDLKNKLEERKAECKKKGIEIENDSPLRVAKKFLLCVRAKDVQGMKDLITGGSDAEKENAAKQILDRIEKEGSVEKLNQLKRVGRTCFGKNEKRDHAGVPIEDQSTAYMSVTGETNPVCIHLVKMSGRWLVDAGMPFCKKFRITNALLPLY